MKFNILIENVTVEHLGIKEIDALIADRWQAQVIMPSELQMSEDTMKWFVDQMPKWSIYNDILHNKVTGYVNKYSIPVQVIPVTLNDDIPLRSIKVIDYTIVHDYA